MLTLLKNASVYAPESLGQVDVLLADQRIAAIAPKLPALPKGLPDFMRDWDIVNIPKPLAKAHMGCNNLVTIPA